MRVHISVPGVANPPDNIAVSPAGLPPFVLSSFEFGQMSETIPGNSPLPTVYDRTLTLSTDSLRDYVCISSPSMHFICGETQTMSHNVESCQQTRLHGGLSKLHSAYDDAVAWLTSYGS